MRIVCSILVLMTGMVRAETVLQSTVHSDGIWKTVRFSEREPFTLSSVERRARVELSRAKRVPFVQITFYGHHGGAPLPLPTHSSDEHWRKLYETQKERHREIAELVSFGGNAVLRLRDSSGKLVRRVLQGTDPLQYTVRGTLYEILSVGNTLHFRTTASLDVATGNQLVAQLKRVLPESLRLNIEIRNNEWLMDPIANPFIFNVPAPSDIRSPTMFCNFYGCVPPR